LDAGNNEALGTLSCEASKKRQGTKSREVGHRLGSEHYGNLMSAPTLMVPGSDRDVWIASSVLSPALALADQCEVDCRPS
jgi:hypothetical protein